MSKQRPTNIGVQIRSIHTRTAQEIRVEDTLHDLLAAVVLDRRDQIVGDELRANLHIRSAPFQTFKPDAERPWSDGRRTRVF